MNKISKQTEKPAGVSLQCLAASPQRILVVEDDGDIRRLNAELLAHAGYQVDSAEDGADAWATLQRKRYHLMITDNDMPNLTGVELLKRVHAAHLDLPVIMATGTMPQELIQSPWLQPAALLIKPYSFIQLRETVQNVLRLAVVVTVLQACLTGSLNAQTVQPVPPAPIPSSDTPAKPSAMTTAVSGKCEFSNDGVTFAELEQTHVLEQGALVRTGSDGRIDLFFRHTGTTVRLQAGTEIKLEKMTQGVKDGLPVENTLLDLRTGRIFTVFRSEVVGSTLEIRNAAGRSVVEGSGSGRYIITADGTHVNAAGSAIPLKVIGENGITVVAAGEQFEKKDGKPLPAATQLWVKDMIEMDELQAVAEKAIVKANPPRQ